MKDLPDGLVLALAGRYTIEREIGFGGMATVYLAEDVKHHRKVAVKVLKPELAATLGTDRFLREIEIAAQLNHPHILPLLDSGEAGGFLHYVMPFVAGDSLRHRLSLGKPLDLEETNRITSQVAGALEHAHRRGVIHRDIKPENILFSEGLAVVADFGIAKALSSVSQDVLTRSGFPVGTLGYMSPEQAAGNTDLDPTTDVCSLACVVFEMLVGQTPGVWATPDEVKVGRFQYLSEGHRELLDRLPGRVEQVLVKALAIRPHERYSTPSEFMEALDTASTGSEKLDAAEVDSILARVTDLDANSPNDGGALSMGGVEQVAAQVGIPPESVRDAALAIGEPKANLVRGGYFGLSGKIEMEQVLDVALSSQAWGAFVQEARGVVGEAGRINETFDDSRLWEGRLVTTSRRRVELLVDPLGEGRTRIRVLEHTGEDLAVAVVSAVAGTALAGFLIAGIASNASVLGGIVVGGGFWAGQYAICRAWYHAYLKKRTGILSELINRMFKRAIEREEPAGVLPGGTKEEP